MAVNYARLTPSLEFDGTKPQETLDFLDLVEMRGRVLGCPELQLVGLVEMSIREVAKDWYREHILPLEGIMTWPQFR